MSIFNKIKIVISDYQKARAKRESDRQETIRKEWEAAKKAKINYYTELITQCNSNVNYIVAKTNTLNANISGLGKRGFKELKMSLNKELHQLEKRLEEEKFLVNHYSNLRDAA